MTKENNLVLDAAYLTATQIKVTEAKYYNLRKGSRQNFNFFEGLVNGKATKTHIEQYHSNFIAYLLDPSASHDCDFLFSNKFIDLLKEKTENIQCLTVLNAVKDISVEREKNTGNGNIDIVIESKPKACLIFIENKIRSDEGNHQLLDYCRWAEHNFQGCWLGVYLTKEREPPKSSERDQKYSDEYKDTVVLLSYQDVIHWIESCCLDKKLIQYPHITSALIQYINVIKQELHIMEDNERKEMINYLEEHPNKTSLLVEKIDDLKSILDDFIKEKRQKFQEEIFKILKENISNLGIIVEDEKGGIINCTYKGNTFGIEVSQGFPGKDGTGRGLWWGVVYPIENKTRWGEGSWGPWTSVLIDKVEDYTNDAQGSVKIINPNLKGELLSQIAEDITGKIKKEFLSFLDNKPQ